MTPKVSILWINYNSAHFIDLTLDSLKAVKDLDYPNYELIVVDNGSTDKSFKILKGFLKKIKLDSKIIQLEKNLGFTGGNNIAYATRSRESKYVVLLNNDAVPKQGSLSDLVEYMEMDQCLGASQGVILNLDERSIDTAGDYLSELLEATSLFQGSSPVSLKKPVYATSADAAYSIFRVKAINSIANQNGRLFPEYLFGYFDDHILGLKLWNAGFSIKVFPIITAKHGRGTSFKKPHSLPLRTYLRARNLLILNEIANSRYKTLIKLLCFRQLFNRFFPKIASSNIAHKIEESQTFKAFIDGIRIGKARNRLGERIDIYKAPILEVHPSTAFLGTTVSLQLIGSHIDRNLNKIAIYNNDVY